MRDYLGIYDHLVFSHSRPSILNAANLPKSLVPSRPGNLPQICLIARRPTWCAVADSMDWKYALRLAFPGLSFHALVFAKLHKRLVAEEEEQVLLDAILEHEH